MKELWTRFAQDESGQGLVEYILVIAVVAIGLLAVLYAFRGKIKTAFTGVGSTLAAQPTSTEAP